MLRESEIFSIPRAVLNATDTSPDSIVSSDLSFILLMCATLVVVHVSLLRTLLLVLLIVEYLACNLLFFMFYFPVCTGQLDFFILAPCVLLRRLST